RATEALRRATQSAILAEARLDAVTTAELADRLAHVCAVVAEAAAASHAPASGAPAADVAPYAAASGAPAADAAWSAAAPAAPAAPLPADEPRSAPRPAPIAPPGEDEPYSLRARADRRAEAGSWEAAVARQLERHAHDGSPFALLGIEADGLERLISSQED